MTTLRALIVDDERLAREELRYLLSGNSDITVIGEADSVETAADLIESTKPDLLFLDVQLSGETGFDLLDETRVDAKVVFVTAYDEFALRAFEVNAVDYLMKPVNPERLRQSIARTRDGAEPAPPPKTLSLSYDDAVFVTIDQSPRFVKLALLVCITAEGDYTRLVGIDGPIGLVLKTMKEWEAILPERRFCRIQRSIIINCEHVERFEAGSNGTCHVFMKHLDTPMTMSRRFARKFRERFEV